MDSIYGKTVATIRATLSKALEMDTEYGAQTNSHAKCTRDTTVWIRSQVMEFMNGKMDGFIREISIVT